ESRIAELRRQISMMSEEVTVHEWIVRLGRNPKVLNKLGELADGPELVEKLSGKEVEIAKGEGIELPAGSRVTLKKSKESDSVVLTLEAAHGNIPFSLIW